ncbi:MAG: phosphoribosylamine--glycine ligase [Bacteroidales bacterium]|nr:phosphoribosylamine--glycine ligase [Bacteroidales bacterium]
MKTAIIGSGGREHALARKFAQTLTWDNVFTLPGNGGIPNSHMVNVNDFEELERFCMYNSVEMIFVGPEQPLAAGIVDYFKEKDIKVFGPDKHSAKLEASKIFAKQFMQKYNIATAGFEIFNNLNAAKYTIANKLGDLVIKFDGLAAGKGVFVCSTSDEANDALHELETAYGKELDFIIEDKISGDEISIIGFTDGKSIKLLQASQDHKQLLDGDKGPNTGGMGAYSPISGISDELMQKIQDKIVNPTLKGIQAEQMDYKGVIYFGIMVKDAEPYLLEYNVRFGDPETEVLLPALKNDLYEIVTACLSGELNKIEFEFENAYFADIVLASGGYPKSYDKGFEIKGLDDVSKDTLIFHAGTKKEDGKIFTNGGRVLNIVCKGKTLNEALENAYNEVNKISFKNMYFRKDIGKRVNKYFK